jgi:Protein kinase domain
MSSDGQHTEFMRPRLSPGTRLNGIYEIDHPIGLGGMGEIYKGHLVETGDPVAIKLMLQEVSMNEAAFTLFRKEASALHHIQHDAVVRYYVFTVEPVLRRPYLAMEFVDGRTLTEMLDEGPLSFEAARSLLQRLASGLQAAHQHGIVHRDISPDNIICPNNDVTRAKIIDFGIARTNQHGTVIGSGFAGKFSYVSPEQLGLFGGDVTGKSDIYSLGLVLAQALTGKALDMGGSQVEIIEKRRKLPELGAIDMRFRPLLERMLQPDPAQRPESMAAVAAWSLGSAPLEPSGSARAGAAERSAAGRKAGISGRWRLAAAGLLLIALIGGGGGAYYFYALQTPGAAPASPPPNLARPETNSPSGLAPPLPTNLAKSEAEPEKNAALAAPAALSAKDKIKNYVEQYDGGNCFFVAPVALSEHAAALEGFGASAEPFRSFDTAFKRALGFEADIGIRQVSEQQCPAIAFLARLRGEAARAPHLDIDQEDVHNGSVLSGMIDRYGERQLALFLVSDSGTVQNISSLLKAGTDAKTFKIGMKRAEGVAGRQPQLLIAVTSSSPLNALQPGEPAKADQLFGRLLSEASSSGAQLSAAARYFVLDQ